MNFEQGFQQANAEEPKEAVHEHDAHPIEEGQSSNDSDTDEAKKRGTTRENHREALEVSRQEILLAGNHIRVPAYADEWEQEARRLRENLPPVERQLETFLGQLSQLEYKAEDAKKLLAAMRDADSTIRNKVLSPEVEARLSDRLQPFQALYEYHAVLNAMGQALDEVIQVANNSTQDAESSELQVVRNSLIRDHIVLPTEDVE